MNRREFLEGLARRGFEHKVEDAPNDDGPSKHFLSKFCLEEDCTRKWQQHSLGDAELYDPQVLALLYAVIVDRDCGHGGISP